MLGERLPAVNLHALGVVNELAPAGGAFAAALKLADQLNQRAPNIMASVKELINEAQTNTLSEQLNSERHHFVKSLLHSNSGEGIEAFLQKRKPQFP
jgi:enoyl-CoA hydratase/carnithine racemase